MIKVVLKSGEGFESLLRRFSNAVVADGILKEYKEKSVYDKPSIKKRKAKKQRKMELLSLK